MKRINKAFLGLLASGLVVGGTIGLSSCVKEPENWAPPANECPVPPSYFLGALQEYTATKTYAIHIYMGEGVESSDFTLIHSITSIKEWEVVEYYADKFLCFRSEKNPNPDLNQPNPDYYNWDPFGGYYEKWIKSK